MIRCAETSSVCKQQSFNYPDWFQIALVLFVRTWIFPINFMQYSFLIKLLLALFKFLLLPGEVKIYKVMTVLYDLWFIYMYYLDKWTDASKLFWFQVILRFLLQRDIAVVPKSVTSDRIIENFQVVSQSMTHRCYTLICTFVIDKLRYH